jgi:hypothetical protein
VLSKYFSVVVDVITIASLIVEFEFGNEIVSIFTYQEYPCGIWFL